MKLNLLTALLFVTFFNGVLFSLFTPIWHGPDEQAHFGQVALIAEYGVKRPPEGKDLTSEIYNSEVLLGTLRNERGNNKFTFNPDYRIEYTDSTAGKYEQLINNQSIDTRKSFSIQEATNYPPVFYYLSSVPYYITYNLGLIDRVFAVRLTSILMMVGMVYFSFLIAKELLPNNRVLQFTLPILVSFHPMLSFLFATVNSDNLMNLLFSIILYQGILIIQKGLTLKLVVGVIAVLILGLFTKIQFILAVPILIAAFILYLGKNKSFTRSHLIFGLIAVFITSVFLIINPGSVASVLFAPAKVDVNFFQFIQSALIQTYREAMPWYWGVFNWLGVTYPRLVHRIVNLIVLLAMIGLIIHTFKVLKEKKFSFFKQDEMFYCYFLLLSAIIYYFGLTIYDYFYFRQSGGVSIGVQGRYFFPTIISHLAILMIGFISIAKILPSKVVNNSFLTTTNFAKFLVTAMIVFNSFALYIVAQSYYDTSSFNTFFNQLSQYKPGVLKYPYALILIISYISILVLFLVKFLKLKDRNHVK